MGSHFSTGSSFFFLFFVEVAANAGASITKVKMQETVRSIARSDCGVYEMRRADSLLAHNVRSTRVRTGSLHIAFSLTLAGLESCYP
jgi:hypothetical protein